MEIVLEIIYRYTNGYGFDYNPPDVRPVRIKSWLTGPALAVKARKRCARVSAARPS